MKTWNKPRFKWHKSGRYYARLYVRNKEKWVSLKTTLLSVAKARLKSDEQVNGVREAQDRREDIKSGKMLLSDAIALFKQGTSPIVPVDYPSACQGGGLSPSGREIGLNDLAKKVGIELDYRSVKEQGFRPRGESMTRAGRRPGDKKHLNFVIM